MKQLSLIAIRTEGYEEAAEELRHLLREVVENLGVVEVAGSLGVTARAIYQALSGRDNRKAPVEWLPALLDLDAEHRVIRRLCELAGGDFVPRDRRTAEEKLQAYREECLRRFGTAASEAEKAVGL